MTIEYMAPGVKCDLACKYCYQNEMRDAGNFSTPLDWNKVRERLDHYNRDFVLFGGEALLTPEAHMREVFEYGFNKYKKNGIQTNLLRLNDNHIQMFKEFNVHVGISIDGPWPLNSPRSSREQTERIVGNIERLTKVDLIPSFIITIHRENAIRIDELIGFCRWLRSLGCYSFNFHILEVDSLIAKKDLELTDKENFAVFASLYDALGAESITPFSDITELLTKDEPNANCVWHACDVLNTAAVQGIMPDGGMVNCGRATKDGVNWVKNTDRHVMERYHALYQTPQEYGGCKDCKYFFACKGQCPGTAIDGDWRNKTVHCEFWYSLIGHIELDLRDKCISILPDEIRRKKEANLLAASSETHQDMSHGDTPHGDFHGDHTDINREVVKVYNIAELMKNAKTGLQAR